MALCASFRRLAKELNELNECTAFSFINVIETSIDEYTKFWTVEVDKQNNDKGQLKVEFSFPRMLFI